MRKINPTVYNNCQEAASVNYSMLNQFTAVSIYRFFCASLYRDEFYNSRIKIKELAELTGEKEGTTRQFSKEYAEYLNKKYFREHNNSCLYNPKRCIYHIPPMDYSKCIAISKRFTKMELPAKVKGYFIKLLLLSQCGNIDMTATNIKKALKMDKKTFDKYNNELYIAGLLRYEKECIHLVTSDILLPNDYKSQKVISMSSIPKIDLPNFTINT